MATDLEAELCKNSLPGAKSILPPDSGFAATGSGGTDRLQDRRSSFPGTPSSGALNATKAGTEATSGRVPASGFDIFKKIRRAERFGIPVYLSEAEKRYSRAERFGIDSARSSDEMAKAEELKRMARAERFEFPTLSAATDEEARKKARLARFVTFS